MGVNESTVYAYIHNIGIRCTQNSTFVYMIKPLGFRYHADDDRKHFFFHSVTRAKVENEEHKKNKLEMEKRRD